jgi:hypothetical protein
MLFQDIMNKFFTTLLLVAIQATMSAQYSSIFSQYGLGKIQSPVFGPNRGAGELAAGYNSPVSINYVNPASYTAATFTIFDVGGFVENGTTQIGDSMYKSSNGTLSHIAFLLPIKANKWGLSFGMMPYSSIKYNSIGMLHDSIAGAIEYTTNQSGAINQIYLGTAYKIQKWSIGLNVGYLFGNVVNTKTYYIADSVGLDSRRTISTTMKSFNYNLGVQYNTKVNKNDYLTLGAYATSKVNAMFDSKVKDIVFFNSGSSFIERSVTDSFPFNYLLPVTYGLGITYTKNNFITYGVDFRKTDWGSFGYNTGRKPLNNAWKLGVGIEYKPVAKENVNMRKYTNKIIYRIGGSIGKSESNVSIGSINEFAFNSNLSFPMMNSKLITYLNLGFDYGSRGFDSKEMSERYWRINLGFTITDKWFTKVKFD